MGGGGDGGRGGGRQISTILDCSHFDLNIFDYTSQKCLLQQSIRSGYGPEGGGRVVRRCWVNFQCWGVLLIWIIEGQWPTVLVVGAGGVFGHFFSHLSLLFSFPLSLGDGPI